DWQGRDWGGQFHAAVAGYVDLGAADFIVPAMAVESGKIVVLSPVRPEKYSGALNVMRRVLRAFGGVANNAGWSLHSPRFFFPTFAGQLRLQMEERRTLGRWGPGSGMPVRYDRARCVTELLLKYDIVGRVRDGFTPARDFEVPESRAPSAAAAAPAVTQALTAGRATPDEDMVLNGSSMMMHRQSEDEPRRTRCSFWWAQSRAPVEAIRGAPGDYVDIFVRCER
ncbi:unnamed protein product, partial [Prorocentrum cordatum]